MQKQNNHQKDSQPLNVNFSTFPNTSQGERRKQEMKRRFIMLKSRKIQLERELKSLKELLLSLDKQMHAYQAYEKYLTPKTRNK